MQIFSEVLTTILIVLICIYWYTFLCILCLVAGFILAIWWFLKNIKIKF
jgi:hypothetical protein